MGKPKAEIQRNYRERKKEKEGEEYLQKDRERKYYIPIDKRSKKDTQARREKVKSWVRKHREKKQAKDSTTTDANTSSMIVKLRFPTPNSDPKCRTRKRVSRITARQRKELEKLNTANETLRRKYHALCRKYNRKNNNNQMKSNSTVNRSRGPITPRKRTMQELRAEGVSPSKIPKAVFKKLLLKNAVTVEIQNAKKTNGIQGKQLVSRVLSGKIIKKNTE